MPRYLVDANLPRYFSQWNTPEYIHQHDLEASTPDQLIWEYARLHGLTIISKDSDFSNRILQNSPPPKVIHVRLGNMSMRDFHGSIERCWKDVLILSETHKLVIVWKDRLEGVR